MRKKKPIILPEVVFTGIADKGQCVGKSQTGQVVFATGAVPGDVADVLVYKKRKEYYLGVVKHIHSFSSHRREAFCAHFGACGGCKWQHFDYQAQMQQKEDVVRQSLTRIGKVAVGEWLPILGAPQSTEYRNKLEFSFSGKRWLAPEELGTGVSNVQDVIGFHPAGGFDKVIDIQHCWLQPEPSNKIRNLARSIGIGQGLRFYDTMAQQGFLRNLMLRTTTLGQTMALVSFGYDDPEKSSAFLSALLEQAPEITTLIYCINTKLNDTVFDLEMHSFHGPGYVEETLGEVRFRIGPKSFFQTNSRQAETLYSVARDFAGLQGNENVYDLYTGIGSIALFIAGQCRQVVGIEEIGAAVEDARINAERNGIGNARFYAGDVKQILTPEFALEHGRPDVLITDPPRAGMHPEVVRILLELSAPKVVYVSCNPATQARDLNLLQEKYDVLKVRPVDMFPHTHHIENVALLQLRDL
ncbi:MAG: 23S rRNA (uracil(1939)-C(5))-methyltransferase RlmD [Haliscomenobacter sp.]|nr:23S rRNA (uracil(1939)-C(5))-methyltransferase RlmD [Haliscomenobacter sp.]